MYLAKYTKVTVRFAYLHWLRSVADVLPLGTLHVSNVHQDTLRMFSRR